MLGFTPLDTEFRMPAMMTNNKNSYQVVINDAIQNRKREPMNETSSNIELDDSM